MTMAARILVARDGPECHYCGAVCQPHDPGGPHASVDHRTPQSRGGSDHPRNLVLACSSCNSRKRDRPYLEFVFEVLPHLDDPLPQRSAKIPRFLSIHFGDKTNPWGGT